MVVPVQGRSVHVRGSDKADPSSFKNSTTFWAHLHPLMCLHVLQLIVVLVTTDAGAVTNV